MLLDVVFGRNDTLIYLVCIKIFIYISYLDYNGFFYQIEIHQTSDTFQMKENMIFYILYKKLNENTC